MSVLILFLMFKAKISVFYEYEYDITELSPRAHRQSCSLGFPAGGGCHHLLLPLTPMGSLSLYSLGSLPSLTVQGKSFSSKAGDQLLTESLVAVLFHVLSKSL